MIVEFLSNKRKVKRLAKGLLSMTLSLIIGLSSLAIIPYVSPTAEAATQYTSGYYTYERLDSVHAKIVDVDSSISGAVTIPETLDGYTVSVIDSYAFAWLRNITQVTIPAGVTTIKNEAFFCCSELISISLPESLMYIYDYAFQHCDSLVSVTIPNGVLSLGDGVFDGCDSLNNVTFGSKVSILGDYIFQNCPNLSAFYVSSSNPYLKVNNGALINGYKLVAYPPAKTTANYTLPSGITSVERGAFSGCKNLKTVSVSNNVAEISYYAFRNCTNLTSVSLPKNVKTIKGGAFYDCSSLATINTSNVQYLGYSAFNGCSALTSVDISNVNYWDEGVFSGCSSLSSVSIPNTVSEIPAAAFYSCKSLSSFSLPSGITEIGSNAFYNTAYYNNESNWNSDGLLYKGSYLLSGGKAAGDVSVKTGCVLIAGNAFYGNKNISSVTVSDSVKYIGASAFSSCTELTDVELGEQVITIGNYAFSNCAKLTNVKFNDKVTQIGEYAFSWNKAIEDVALPSSVTTIAYGTFQGCTNLKNVHISNSVKKIDSCAFRDCDNLEKVFYLGVSDEWKSVKIDSYRNEGVSDSSKIYFDATVKFHSGTTDVYFEDSWFGENNYSYNHSLAQFCADYVMMGYSYNESSVKSYLSKMGFDKCDVNMHTGRDGVNYFIASRNIVLNGEINKLVFVGTIGSYENQWYSNFDPYGKERETDYAGNVEKDMVHLGFADARDFVYGKLKTYINSLNVDKEDVKILLAGHSRGAATANLLAAKLINETYKDSAAAIVTRNNIYAYTFATPNTTSNEDVFAEKYKFIFNVVNPEDFVTKVLPNDWGYYRYGKTFVLPSRTNDANWKTYLKKMNGVYYKYADGKEYEPYSNGEKSTAKILKSLISEVHSLKEFYNKKITSYCNNLPNTTLWDISNPVEFTPYEFFRDSLCGIVSKQNMESGGLLAAKCLTYPSLFQKVIKFFLKIDWLDTSLNLDINLDFAQAHGMETYAAYMKTMTYSQLKEIRLYYENIVNCPVDIEVYDNTTNEIVGKITNNIIDETVAASENAIVMDIDGDSKSFWLPSNGDYRVVLTGNDEGTMDYTVSDIDSDTGETIRANFFDVEIQNDVTMEGYFVSNETTVDSYVLTHEEMGTVNPTEILSKDQLKSFTVITSVDGNGVADEELTVTSGDYVTVTAYASEGGMFNGWYDNGKLVSTGITYSFVVKENKNLVAKFTDFTIKTPSTTTINYGDAIVLHADIDRTLPDGAHIEWSESNGNFDMSVSADGLTCKISPKSSGKTVFTATVYDKEGNVIGIDTQEMNAKAGLWQKIVAFFKKIFGLTKTFPEAFKSIL